MLNSVLLYLRETHNVSDETSLVSPKDSSTEDCTRNFILILDLSTSSFLSENSFVVLDPFCVQEKLVDIHLIIPKS